MTEQTLNIPQLVVVILIGGLLLRWFFYSNSSSPTPSSSSSRSRNVGRVDPEAVERIAQMFPQLNRRSIMLDLQRNGGNIAATTERVLNGRGLDTVCPSFIVLRGLLAPNADIETTAPTILS